MIRLRIDQTVEVSGEVWAHYGFFFILVFFSSIILLDS